MQDRWLRFLPRSTLPRQLRVRPRVQLRPPVWLWQRSLRKCPQAVAMLLPPPSLETGLSSPDTLANRLAAKPNAHNSTLTGTATMPNLVAAPTLDHAITLVAQPPAIRTGDILQVTRPAGVSGAMLFVRAIEVTDNTGEAESGVNKTTVPLYSAGIATSASSGVMYAANLMAQSGYGHVEQLIGLEADINVDPHGTSQASGMLVTGNAGKPLQWAYGINMQAGAFRTNSGFQAYVGGASGGLLEGATFDDQVPSTYALRSIGAKTTAIDLSGTTSSSGRALNLPSGTNGTIYWAGTGSTFAQMYMAGGNFLIQAPVIFVASTILPLTDNAYAIGSGVNRFTTGYFVNGVSSSSDSNLKTDIEDLPGDVAHRSYG